MFVVYLIIRISQISLRTDLGPFTRFNNSNCNNNNVISSNKTRFGALDPLKKTSPPVIHPPLPTGLSQ